MTAPSGEERCAPHHTVPVSPQCLQEIGLPTLPLMVLQGRSGLQRALLSVSSTRKRSRTERLAAPSRVSRAARSDVPCWSSASGHRASSSKHIRGQSRETGSFSRSPGGVGSPAKHVSLGPEWCTPHHTVPVSSVETGSLSRLFGSVETTSKCVSIAPAHCRERLSHSVRRSTANFQQGHSHAGGS